MLKWRVVITGVESYGTLANCRYWRREIFAMNAIEAVADALERWRHSDTYANNNRLLLSNVEVELAA